MTYAQLVTLLESLAAGLGAHFWHGKRAQGGIDYNEPFPQIHLYLMPDTIGVNGIRRSIGLGFFGLDSHEGGGVDMVQIQDEMDILSQRYLVALEQEVDAEISGDIARLPVVRTGPAVGTGYYVDFTLTTIRTIC